MVERGTYNAVVAGPIPARPTMKTIGIIGGLGPQATTDLLTRIHAVSQELIPHHVNEGYPPLWAHYFRQAPMMLNPDGSPQDPLEPNPELIEVARKLGPLVDFIIIASNTPHFFAEQISEAAQKEVLNIVDVVTKEVQRRVAKRVGILAIGETVKHALYQEPLDRLGISWVTIHEDLIKPLDKAIFAVMEGRGTSDLGDPARQAVNYLREQGPDQIILGCTELPILLGDEAEAADLINPTQFLAEAAVQKAIG